MSVRISHALERLARKPLAAGLAVLFGCHAPHALATTWTVNSCSDANSGSGTTGTLRYAAANALDNDTIDLSSIGCSAISLHTGAVTFTQNNVTVHGPGLANLTVTGKYNGTIEKDRLFSHTGTGTLHVDNMTLAKGYRYSATVAQSGGCVASNGSVIMSHVGVYDCVVYAKSGGRSMGGAIYAKTSVGFKYGAATTNTAKNGASSGGYGGAIASAGDVTVKYSTISGNTAGQSRGFGGGVFFYHNATIVGSTISGNTAWDNGGGLYQHDFTGAASDSVTIKNSTISGNNAHYYTGGIAINPGKVYLYNSTVAFNTAAKGRFGTMAPFTYRAPGIALDDSGTAVTVAAHLYSNLVANNTYGSTEYDLSVPQRAATTITFSGSNNLVRATFAAVPGDTIKISCPLLGSLRNNGGATQTHALLSRSPGIDVGLNKTNLTDDQRGGGFPRTSGAATDIGAYEIQQNDMIFDANFEGCPLLL